MIHSRYLLPQNDIPPWGRNGGLGGTHDCNMAVYHSLVKIPLYPMGGFGSILKPLGFNILFFIYYFFYILLGVYYGIFLLY